MSEFLAGTHILVVEDEMMIAGMIEDFLADLGYTSVKSASTVDQAFALIDAHRFDAATLDVNLHGTDSYPVADALIRHGVPFAFVTGYGYRGLREEYRGHATLAKPFRKQEFNKVLRSLLDRARM